MGDDDTFSCSYSPMDSPYILTVGAIDELGQIIPGSNFGDCVDMYAPGKSIPAPWKGSEREERNLTGSSASAAIVAGMVATVMGTVRSPDLVYYKTGGSIYERMLEIVRHDDFIIFVRNIFLTAVKQQSEHENAEDRCLVQVKGEEQAVKEVATIQLLEVDDIGGKPATFQRLKHYKHQNHRTTLENYYLD
jgi:predicted nucleic-acid-binding protein